MKKLKWTPYVRLVHNLIIQKYNILTKIQYFVYYFPDWLW